MQMGRKREKPREIPSHGRTSNGLARRCRRRGFGRPTIALLEKPRLQRHAVPRPSQRTAATGHHARPARQIHARIPRRHQLGRTAADQKRDHGHRRVGRRMLPAATPRAKRRQHAPPMDPRRTTRIRLEDTHRRTRGRRRRTEDEPYRPAASTQQVYYYEGES